MFSAGLLAKQRLANCSQPFHLGTLTILAGTGHEDAMRMIDEWHLVSVPEQRATGARYPQLVWLLAHSRVVLVRINTTGGLRLAIQSLGLTMELGCSAHPGTAKSRKPPDATFHPSGLGRPLQELHPFFGQSGRGVGKVGKLIKPPRWTWWWALFLSGQCANLLHFHGSVAGACVDGCRILCPEGYFQTIVHFFW